MRAKLRRCVYFITAFRETCRFDDLGSVIQLHCRRVYVCDGLSVTPAWAPHIRRDCSRLELRL